RPSRRQDHSGVAARATWGLFLLPYERRRRISARTPPAFHEYRLPFVLLDWRNPSRGRDRPFVGTARSYPRNRWHRPGGCVLPLSKCLRLDALFSLARTLALLGPPSPHDALLTLAAPATIPGGARPRPAAPPEGTTMIDADKPADKPKPSPA